MQRHSQFFTSLKHLEKRLKLENLQPQSPQPPAAPLLTLPADPIDSGPQSESLGTPIYLNPTPSANSNHQESEAPHEFLSISPDSAHEKQPDADKTIDRAEKSSPDHDIEFLMQLLRLSELFEKRGVGDVGCDDGFYGKIVGVKGPKSAKEAERLEGWIKWLMEGEIKEPFGLVHLLLGKAGFVHSGDECDGLGEFVFPSTIDDFLGNDHPPME